MLYISFIFLVERNNYQAKKIHLDNLARMVGYCENKTDCRRAQQLDYFGEIFNAELCKQDKATICDNCRQDVSTSFIYLMI